MSKSINNLGEGHVSAYDSGEIDLLELLSALWAEKWTVIVITAAAAVFSVFLALSQPNFYISTALLVPVSSDSSGGGGGLSRYGGLAKMAGISLNSPGGVGEVVLGLEVLKSRAFLTKFIEQRSLMVPLFAFKEWNQISGETIFNDDIYDESSGAWRGSVLPSTQEAFDRMMAMLSVAQDKKTGLIKVTITHQSPVLAQRWVTWLVEDLNLATKKQKIDEAKRSIVFIENQISSTSVIELKTMFFEMIQEQTKLMLLATVRPEYLFKTIDPAIISETKAGPMRAFTCIVGTLLGGVIGCLIAFFRRFGFGLKNKD